ncbi:MAG: 2,3-bisphosphoglycerate-independent phosphoglycerate mutase [Gammaproteobacteria bacterium]|nr:2,3-bisphosphoglycerate-independent phosphoglycerate mutase [Gammaproteobacteria bacterium]
MIRSVLVILDGWGHGEPNPFNAIHVANTPTWDHYWQHSPRSLLECSGTCVGLPAGQMGNSEVGHMAMGAGRTVYQDLTRIDRAIEDGSFVKNQHLEALTTLRDSQRIHVLGLLSPGGVHSHENQICALLEYLASRHSKLSVHAFLDGRDTPPRSALSSIKRVEQLFADFEQPGIASITGRYYAMDRDQRWDRTQKTYDMLTGSESTLVAENATTALDNAYHRSESDEFVQPTRTKYFQPVVDGDVVIFMNFRADRARQLSTTLIQADFDHFPRNPRVHLSTLLTLTRYSKEINDEKHPCTVKTLFPTPEVENSLGEYLAKNNLTQLRLAESEKYAHVTYFFSGGREKPFEGESRKIIDSPAVATYDLQPEMSAPEVTQSLNEAIQSKQFDLIVCNFANGDMVGHTGVLDASIKAVECVDKCLKTILKTCKENDTQCFITADHGNVEDLYNAHDDQPNTAHTTNLVPFLYVGPKAIKLQPKGTLTDVAPTILSVSGYPIPTEMTGTSLDQ